MSWWEIDLLWRRSRCAVDVRLVVVFCAAVLIVCREPKSGALALFLFMGKAIVAGHALPSVLGERVFSAPFAPWSAEGWLAALGVYGLWSLGGYPALVVAEVLLAAATFFLVEERCRLRGLGTWSAAAAVSLAFLCAVDALRTAGGILDLFFAAAFFWCVERFPRRSALGIFPLTVLWCNCSMHGFVAPLLGLIAACGRAFETSPRERGWLGVTFASPFVAALLTPASAGALSHYAEYVHVGVKAGPQAWEAMYVNPLAFYLGFVPLLLLACWCGLLTGGMRDLPVTLGVMSLVFLNGEYLGVCGIVAAPIILSVFLRGSRGVPDERRLNGPNVAMFWGVVCSMALFSAQTASVYRTGFMDSQRDQKALIDSLAADGTAHRLMCADPTWCNYALLNGGKTRVFMDGRAQAYPERIHEDQYAMVQLDPNWRKRLRAWDIDAVMIGKTRLASMLSLSAAWACSTQHGDILLCERRR